MAWSIPGKGTAQNNIMSVLYAEQLNILLAGINGIDCVLAGCAVTAQGTPDMTVAVAKGSVLTNGVLKPVVAGNATITTANSTNPRLDLVVVNSSGTVAVRAGTAAAAPIPPARTANDVVIAMVYVPASDTTISSDQIVDMRVIRTGGPITIYRTATKFTQNTLATIFTLFTLTIPNGLFLAGRVLRVRLGGNYLFNSGTPTFIFTLSYGGTTFFADVTTAATASANRGAWTIDFEVAANANADQQVSGNIAFSTQGAKTAPTTGVAGDLLLPAAIGNVMIITPFYGTAAVDSDAADRILLAQGTMNVSNAADEIVMNFASVELV